MFIVIEVFPIENAAVVTNEDGTVKIFDDEINAKIEANDCQNGIVVEV